MDMIQAELEAPRSKTPDTIRKASFLTVEFTLRNPELVKAAEIDLNERYDYLVSEVTRGMSFQTQKEWRAKKVEDLASLEFANRVGNEMRVRLTSLGEFGQFYLKALGSATLADHAQPHGRMVKASEKMFYIVCPDLKDTQDRQFALADGLFPWFHDSLQLLRRAQNETLPVSEQRDPRMLHEEEAAIFAKLLTPLVAESAGISQEEADKVTTLLAIYALCHDKHADYKDMIAGTQKAFTLEGDKTVPVEDSVLVDLYKTKQLDLTSLSGKQWFTIFDTIRLEKEEKNPTKLPKDSKSLFGLIPVMERTFMAQIENQKQSTTPSFKDFSQKQREALTQHMDINVLADVFDMGFPYMYAIPRKLCGSKALHRPVSEVYVDGPDGTDIRHSDQTRSDNARTTIEYYMMLKFLQRSPFWQDQRFKEIMVYTVLVHAVKAQEVYEDLMREAYRPDHEAHSHAVGSLIDSRVRSVQLKALKKHGGIPREVYEKYKAMDTVIDMSDVLHELSSYPAKNKTNNNYARRLPNAVNKLRKIEEEASINLWKKPKPQILSERTYQALQKAGVRSIDQLPEEDRQYALKEQEAWHGYSQEDIARSQKGFEEFFKVLCQESGIIDTQNDSHLDLMETIKTGDISTFPILRSQGTTSLGDIHEAKTIHDVSSFLAEIPDTADELLN
jgi:hypothetical protein